jgi:hypothetical protein
MDLCGSSIGGVPMCFGVSGDGWARQVRRTHWPDKHHHPLMHVAGVCHLSERLNRDDLCRDPPEMLSVILS